MAANTCDFLVIGGGVIGVNLALQAKHRLQDAHVDLIQKEANYVSNASGSNSGVLHAGIYYTSDTLKERLTRDGNSQLKEYIEKSGLGRNR